MKENPTVEEYMGKDYKIVDSNMTKSEAKDVFVETSRNILYVRLHNGSVGRLTPVKLLKSNKHSKVIELCDTDITVAREDMKLKSAGRIMFREGLDELPVIRDGEIVGVITNRDVIRGQIEKTKPRKVRKISEMIKQIHDVKPTKDRASIEVDSLVPSQPKVFRDELEARKRELRNGLAEPVIVVKTKNENVLSDGHHRCVAAHDIGIEKIEAYILEIEEDIEIGLLKNARERGLNEISDVEIDEGSVHPIISESSV